MIKKHIGFGFWLFVGSLALAGLFIGVSIAVEQAANARVASETSREVALTCTTDMATQFHIHPELKISINGVEQVIPANIGIKSTCMTSIHTHDATGVIHVEAPVKKDFTLGDFFAVWGKTFNKDQIFDFVATPESPITVSVNGKVVDTYENTIMNDKDQIVIMYTTK